MYFSSQTSTKGALPNIPEVPGMLGISLQHPKCFSLAAVDLPLLSSSSFSSKAVPYHLYANTSYQGFLTQIYDPFSKVSLDFNHISRQLDAASFLMQLIRSA